MNIYVSNLGDKITDKVLEDIFKPYGKVQSTRLILDGFTGYPRGFAFIEMPDDKEAADAIAHVNGMEIEGRTIGASEAKPQTEHKGSYAIGKSKN